MSEGLTRRSALAWGAATAVGAVTGAAAPATPAAAYRPDGALSAAGGVPDPGDQRSEPRPTSRPPAEPPAWQQRIRRVYEAQRARAGGLWHAYVGAFVPGGATEPIVADDPNYVIEPASVQKLAVAAAVLDKVDRGELDLAQRLDVPADIVLGGSGLFHLQPVWGDQVTVAHVLAALVVLSDNTAVRLCGQVAPPAEINAILAAKGFQHTRVLPAPEHPTRFYLGETTPRETTDLLARLANRTLLSPASTDLLLTLARSPAGYHDGVRRVMSSAQRARIAVKHGADDHLRHEVGLIFDPAGAPALVFGFFADGLGDRDNYGATHPAVQAHAELGRAMLDALDEAG
ncbi:MAG TPA: serine hydrolase [Pilimelia sp.]|nr:serine hydrolase [Pilimelia sp.]